VLCRWLYQIRVVNMKKLYKCPYSSEKNISFLLLPDKICIHGTKIKKNNSFWFSKLILFQQMNTDWENLYFSMIFPHQMLVLSFPVFDEIETESKYPISAFFNKPNRSNLISGKYGVYAVLTVMSKGLNCCSNFNMINIIWH
jgi:hypothetical protein